ncbi:neuronal acetylcholine receptor subunit alpha-3-like, partial [Ruditapes philippinarum]|uniref:neuronal acetylcholine receptor subunit alpha-3-like n=1 Tax=Ruditapes philippinarum TaxID=129788 RepID=UPI00295A7EA3
MLNEFNLRLKSITEMDFTIKSLKCLLFFSGLVSCINGYSYTGERSIRSSVLSSFAYDRMARPNDSTIAKIGYNLLAINDVDIDEQSFSCTGWLTVLWEDERLVWNPIVYDDTEYIHALETEIWKPEILISNEHQNVGLVSDDHLIYRIRYNGKVAWEPVLSTKVDCSVDATYFPFDNQECSIEVTSWGLPDKEMKLELLWDDVLKNELRESGTWAIISSNAKSSTVTEDVQGVVE